MNQNAEPHNDETVKDDGLAASDGGASDRAGDADGVDDADRRTVNRPAMSGGLAPSLLQRFDGVMAEHPWYPRVIPFLTYLLVLAVTGFITERIPAVYPILYTLQCGLVVWLLWRYRKLLPELTLSFHWLAVPIGVIVFVGWVWIGLIVDELAHVRAVGVVAFTQQWIEWSLNPSANPVFTDANARADSPFNRMNSEALRWTSLSLRLLGMSIVVPLFEELFIRSLLLRSFNSARNTGIGLVQVAEDLPIVGEWVMDTKAGRRAEKHPPMFEREFLRVPLGKLTVFGVAASTLVFALNHVPRDYAACVFCGVAYCLCLWATRHKGLGPVCWAHGITNALLWGYTLWTDDWRFL